MEKLCMLNIVGKTLWYKSNRIVGIGNVVFKEIKS